MCGLFCLFVFCLFLCLSGWWNILAFLAFSFCLQSLKFLFYYYFAFSIHNYTGNSWTGKENSFLIFISSSVAPSFLAIQFIGESPVILSVQLLLYVIDKAHTYDLVTIFHFPISDTCLIHNA